MFRSETGQPTNFKDLFKILKANHDDSIFGLNVTQVLVEHVWSNYKWQVMEKIFLPFLCHISLVHLYFWALIFENEEHHAFNPFTLEFWLRNILIALSVFFLKKEMDQYIEDGYEYFYDIFNYVFDFGLTM